MARRKTFKSEERQQILKKCNNHCAYCGCKLTLENMTVDHVVPISSTGTNDFKNLLPACKECNSIKSNKKLKEFRREIRQASKYLIKAGLMKKKPQKLFYFEANAIKM